MPYIDQKSRDELSDIVKVINSSMINNEGELNFLITLLLKNYLETNKESYKTYNAMVGALECAKLELYRRKLISYETGKIKLNGDVWETKGNK